MDIARQNERTREENPSRDRSEEAENTSDEIHVTNSETAQPTPADRTTEEVRQGHTGDHLRYILGYSVAGIVVVFTIVYLLFMR
ncbi:hypothetical protein [Hyphococcus lacteus]|uniref:Uncharacterized protein n=1 Tax=Hyphococcus lacteus TaxID=3143536 RepID=A0ABV3Z1W2_9PROT